MSIEFKSKNFLKITQFKNQILSQMGQLLNSFR
jgi:hypothetical protein